MERAGAGRHARSTDSPTPSTCGAIATGAAAATTSRTSASSCGGSRPYRLTGSPASRVDDRRGSASTRSATTAPLFTRPPPRTRSRTWPSRSTCPAADRPPRRSGDRLEPTTTATDRSFCSSNAATAAAIAPVAPTDIGSATCPTARAAPGRTIRRPASDRDRPGARPDRSAALTRRRGRPCSSASTTASAPTSAAASTTGATLAAHRPASRAAGAGDRDDPGRARRRCRPAGGVVEIADSGRYEETLAITAAARRPAVDAAGCSGRRPTSLPGRRPLVIGAPGADATVTLNGLLRSPAIRSSLEMAATPARLTPAPLHPGARPDALEPRRARRPPRRAVPGRRARRRRGARSTTASSAAVPRSHGARASRSTDSIVDATGPSGRRLSPAPARRPPVGRPARRRATCTVIGKVHARGLRAGVELASSSRGWRPATAGRPRSRRAPAGGLHPLLASCPPARSRRAGSAASRADRGRIERRDWRPASRRRRRVRPSRRGYRRSPGATATGYAQLAVHARRDPPGRRRRGRDGRVPRPVRSRSARPTCACASTSTCASAWRPGSSTRPETPAARRPR